MPEPIITCPFCGHQHEDCFEALDSGVLDLMRCQGCAKDFRFVLIECHRCAREQTRSWTDVPADEVLNDLKCPECGGAFEMERTGEAEF